MFCVDSCDLNCLGAFTTQHTLQTDGGAQARATEIDSQIRSSSFGNAGGFKTVRRGETLEKLVFSKLPSLIKQTEADHG